MDYSKWGFKCLKRPVTVYRPLLCTGWALLSIYMAQNAIHTTRTYRQKYRQRQGRTPQFAKMLACPHAKAIPCPPSCSRLLTLNTLTTTSIAMHWILCWKTVIFPSTAASSLMQKKTRFSPCLISCSLHPTRVKKALTMPSPNCTSPLTTSASPLPMKLQSHKLRCTYTARSL